MLDPLLVATSTTAAISPLTYVDAITLVVAHE